MDNSGEFIDARKPKPAPKTLLWVLVGAVVVLTGAVIALAYPLVKEKMSGEKTPVAGTATSSAISKSKTTTAVQNSNKIVDEGVTWVTPVKLDDLGFFTKVEDSGNMGEMSGVSYYKVGDMSDGSEIIDAVVEVPFGPDIYRIIKKSSVYYKVSKNKSTTSEDKSDYYSEKDLKANDTTVFKSLISDKTITKGKTKLVLNFNGGIERAEDYTEGTKIEDTKWGPLYKEDGGEVPDSSGMLKVGRYYIKLNDSTKAYYDPSPTFLRDDGTLDISWSNSSKKSLSYQKIATGGCGGGLATYPFVAKKSLLDNKEQVASDAQVYFLSDKSNALDQYIYKIYKDSNDSAKSIDDFIENIGMVIWVDDYGNNIVYSNKDYSLMAECGKPVVYLYPKENTSFTVKVGANVTKSEPEYGNGWQGTASPDGKITVGGKSYPYLFWEGLGLGEYPRVKSGTVVARTDAESKIKEQLVYIGLNNREISDFLEFWMPKMPNSKYIRLTWFTNEQMDRLAPLAINPKPDSVIRVFLDFAGSDAKINIPAQLLPQYQRKGYTAVEWGGLLIK